jgi:hypothetical protein
MAGFPAVGSLRAAELDAGAVRRHHDGIGLVAVPEAVCVLHWAVRQLRPFCLLLGSLQGGAAVAEVVTSVSAAQGSPGERLLGTITAAGIRVAPGSNAHRGGEGVSRSNAGTGRYPGRPH